jgi:hypothetical protein
VHEALDYLAGIFLVLAPFLFDLTEETAFPVLLAVGVVLLAMAVLSPGPLGVVSVLPPPVHAALDYVIGFFLILAPFVFSFTDLGQGRNSSIFLGLALLVVSLLTAYPAHEQARQA